MSGEGVLAGTNWTGDLVGLEINAFALREEIEQQLPKETADRFAATYATLTDRNEQEPQPRDGG